MKNKRDQVKRLKRNHSASPKSLIYNLLQHKSNAVTTFVNMQLFHKKNSKWTKAEKQLALSLHYKSPTAYRFMLETFQFILPSLRTIRFWLKVNNLSTGINNKFTEKLRLKAKSMSDLEKCN